MKKNRIPSEADHRTVQAGRRYGALVLTMLACAALDHYVRVHLVILEAYELPCAGC